MTLQVDAVPAFRDNYIWVLHDGRQAAVVDPGEAEPALRFLARNELTLGAILLTHHHHDHIGGGEKTHGQRRWSAKPGGVAQRLPGLAIDDEHPEIVATGGRATPR